VPGQYDEETGDIIRVLVPPSQQPIDINCDPANLQPEQHFPIHLSCLELLYFHITGRRKYFDKPERLDTVALHFALYGVREDIANMGPHPGLELADFCQAGVWWCFRGFEMLVADPSLPDTYFDLGSNSVAAHLRALISCGGSASSTRNYITPATAASLSSRVKADPFRGLPLELVFSISEFLHDSDLFAWCTASWPVHSALRVNDRFWCHRITKISMPWLVEVVPLLEDDELMSGVDVKGLLCMLDRLMPVSGKMGGPLMGAANRRRIWGVCEDIGFMYDAAMKTYIFSDPEEDMEEDAEEDVLNEQASGNMESSKVDLDGLEAED
jgi:hypothetical protein